jgi:hypothetical protein
VRHVSPLLPYIAAALLIAGASTALVLATAGGNSPDAASLDNVRAAPRLSATGRLAYWRQNPSGTFVLFAANFDGSLPRPLLTLPANSSRPLATRWTGDGSAVAFVGDLGITVVGLDGTRFDIALPPGSRSSGFAVVDQRWSPSGEKVAATVYRSTDGRSDVVIGTKDRRQLTHVADLGNSFAGDWLSNDEVLVESDRGILGALRETGALRRLVDGSAASPILDGGRVYFLVGPTTTKAGGLGIYVQSPAVWSVAPDGTDARREDRLGVGSDLKLDGRWPDGRYLLHAGQDSTQYLSGSLAQLRPLSEVQRALRRVVISADRRSAIGFSGTRLIRIDLTRGLTPSESAFVVLLDGVVGADVWVNRGLLP